MLDPDSVAEYEAWKLHKMTTQQDLSVGAFNAEMEVQALAYEQGVKDMSTGAIARKSPAEVIEDNPYRKPGMRGERVASPTHARIASSLAAPLHYEDDEDEE